MERANKIDIVIIYIFLLSLPGTDISFYFLIKEADQVNVFDAINSSFLFNFDVGLNCSEKSIIIFHLWEGREEKRICYVDRFP